VWNGSGWMFVSIDARLDVQAVADAQRSEVRVGRAGGIQARVNHLERLRIDILARDVEGALINRTGERMSVRLVSSDRTADRTELAQFDAARAMYFAAVTISKPGGYSVDIETETGGPARKAHVDVECAQGYVQNGAECSAEAGKMQAVVGGTIGAVFLVVVVLGLGLLYKNRAHALRFALSFFKREFLLVYKMTTELWDITSDRMPAAAHSVPSVSLRWRDRVHRR
jgi:hypothetical protein